MRSSLLFIGAILWLTGTANAQKITFGPKLGANLISLDKTQAHGQGYALGWHGGGFLDVQVSERFSIQPEIIYSTKRKNYSSSDTTDLLDSELMSALLGDSATLGGLEGFINTDIITEVKGSVSLSYVEIPLPVIFRATKSLSFTAGPYVGLLVGARAKETSLTTIPLFDAISLDSIPEAGFILNFLFPDRNEEVLSETSRTEAYANVNWGLVAGIAYEPAHNVKLELRYTRGLVDYRKEPLGVKNTHTAVQLAIAYRFSAAAFGAPAASEPSME